MSRKMTKVGRGAVLSLAALLLVVLAGCSTGGRSGADLPGGGVAAVRPVPPPRNALPPEGCPNVITDPDDIQRTMRTARPGQRICFSGTELAPVTLQVTASGTREAPIQLLADGARVYGIELLANHVEVAGFTVRGGSVNLRGAGLRVHDNNVLNGTKEGIRCNCSDSVVESNLVDGTDGVGIWVQGERITVRDNRVSGSVRRNADDADGIRFFGNAIRISENVVTDLSVRGYPPDQAPHVDCFQTYDSSGPPVFDVLISNNRCERVDMRCLTSTGKRGNPGVPPGERSISFVRNICDVGGTEAIEVAGFPRVDIRSNTITGPNLFRGIHLTDGSVGSVVIDNVLIGKVDKPVVAADAYSTPVAAEGNRAQG